MRIFVAGFGCEVNSFVTTRTVRADFARRCLYRPGRDQPVALENDGQEEMIRLARADGHMVTAGLVAFAPPGGPLDPADYVGLRDEILGDLAAALPADLILLNLHGASLLADGTHAEADLLVALRNVAGPACIIGAVLDLHAHATPDLVGGADILVAYKTYPHVDMQDRARDLYRLGIAAASGRVQPRIARADCRMLGAFPTLRPPMAALMATVAALEARPGILSVSLIHGFPWGDVAEGGMWALVVADDDAALAQSTADALADTVFAARDAIALRLDPLSAVVAAARRDRSSPLIIADACDNPGGGAPGDSTKVLAALIQAGIAGVALACLADTSALDAAFAAGEGAWIDLAVGGNGPTSGAPLPGPWRVERLLPAAYQTYGEPGDERRIEIGRASVFRSSPGTSIIVTGHGLQAFDPDLFTRCGIDPASTRVLVVKSSVHFLARFAPRFADILFADAPGALDLDFTRLPFHHLRRPLWPAIQHGNRGDYAS